MALTPGEVALLSRLFDEVSSLPPEERDPWLKSLSQSQAQLASRLREMLAQTDATAASDQSYRLPRIPSSAAGAPADAPTFVSGDHVGPYELLRELGVGGMAAVWYARRADGAFERNVALKLPLMSRNRDDIAARFKRECNILAGLEHPGIARLYDAGVSDAGLPFMAMEYVEGQSLTEWCSARGLNAAARLELFMQVLDAVQYAHQKQVVHRDLKPSNIYVDTSGRVRLLDFGVARPLGIDTAAAHAALTTQFGPAITPSYASPEQLRGGVVGPRADIYALGIVLYELLVGRLPYRVAPRTSLAEMANAVWGTLVEPPSHAASRKSEVKRVDRWYGTDAADRLDQIVLRALAKAPSRRQATVAELAHDLREVLAAWSASDGAASVEPAAVGKARAPVASSSPRGSPVGPQVSPLHGPRGTGLPLSDVEREVLRELMLGLQPLEIAWRRGVRLATIRTQIAGLRAKLGLKNIAEIVATAKAEGWTFDDPSES